jgi:hypothetical protein
VVDEDIGEREELQNEENLEEDDDDESDEKEEREPLNLTKTLSEILGELLFNLKSETKTTDNILLNKTKFLLKKAGCPSLDDEKTEIELAKIIYENVFRTHHSNLSTESSEELDTENSESSETSEEEDELVLTKKTGHKEVMQNCFS